MALAFSVRYKSTELRMSTNHKNQALSPVKEKKKYVLEIHSASLSTVSNLSQPSAPQGNPQDKGANRNVFSLPCRSAQLEKGS